MKKLVEAIIGILLPIPTIFVDAIIGVIKSDWPKTFVWKFVFSPLAILGIKILEFLLLVIGIIVLIDAIFRFFGNESFIPNLLDEINDLRGN
jgi:hypothetical protein